jgi:hypothetical protein
MVLYFREAAALWFCQVLCLQSFQWIYVTHLDASTKRHTGQGGGGSPLVIPERHMRQRPATARYTGLSPPGTAYLATWSACSMNELS